MKILKMICVRLRIANICRFCLVGSGVSGFTSGTPHPSVDNNSAVSSLIFPTKNGIFELHLSNFLKKVVDPL